LEALAFLDHEIGVNQVPPVALDGEVLGADKVPVPPQDLRVSVQVQGEAALIVVEVVRCVIEEGSLHKIAVVVRKLPHGRHYDRLRNLKAAFEAFQKERESLLFK